MDVFISNEEKLGIMHSAKNLTVSVRKKNKPAWQW